MRIATALLITAAITAAPAAAQQTGTNDLNAANAAEPTLAGNVVDPATGTAAPANGLDPATGVATDTAATLPPPDPLAVEPAPAPERRDGGGFPWGIFGLIGLVGLLGRSRNSRD